MTTKPEKPPRDAIIHVRTTQERKQRAEQAAAKDGRNLSNWLDKIIDRATKTK